eukprot:765708-Hanusia_phi.AAC.1
MDRTPRSTPAWSYKTELALSHGAGQQGMLLDGSRGLLSLRVVMDIQGKDPGWVIGKKAAVEDGFRV